MLINSALLSKNAVHVYGFHNTYKLLCFTLKDSWKITTINAIHKLKAVSTKSNIIYAYNLLKWEWVDLKFGVKWEYLYLIFAHTAFLLISADLMT